MQADDDAERLVLGSDPGPNDSPVRPRFGISALGGWTGGDTEGGLAGLTIRVGAQLGDWFAVYLQPTALVASLPTPIGGDDDLALAVWLPVIAETTLFDAVAIGAGPSLDFWLDCDPRFRNQMACSENDAAPSFGLHGRVAVLLGVPWSDGRDGGRAAAAFSLEIHPTWFAEGGATVAILGGLGGELY